MEVERTCAGCRTRRSREQLVRFARTAAGAVAFDPEGSLGGRGGYCCRNVDCVDRALRRGGLARTLRVAIDRDKADRLRREAVGYLLG